MIARACDFAAANTSPDVARPHLGVDARELLPWADPYIAQLVRQLEDEQAAFGFTAEDDDLDIYFRPAPAVNVRRMTLAGTPV